MGIENDGKNPQGYMGINPTKQPETIRAQRSPGTSDRRFKLGTVWLNQSTNQVYFLTNVAQGSATWALTSTTESDVDTINSLNPTAGNIIIDGGTNLTDSNAGSTVTLNMDAAITLATSVTSPLYTAGAGVDLDLTAPTGQDAVLKLGDNGGLNEFSVTDSSDVEIFSIDSDGNTISLTSFTSPSYIGTAGADVSFEVAAGFDLVLKSGDAVGANKVSFTDSADAEVASLDSDGTFTAVNIDGIIGATTPAAGTFTTVLASTSLSSPIWTSTGAMALNMAAGAFDLTVKLADASGAQKLSFTDSADAEIASLDSDGQLNLLVGDFVESRSAASLEVLAQVTNSDNTAADSDAFVEVAVGGTSGGNPGIRFQISGGQNFSMGIDNADSDKLVICADNDLGTDVLMKLDETTKNVEISQGNLVLGAVATQLQLNGGAVTDFIGVGTLVAGTVTILNTNIAADDRILVTRSALNASPALGHLITTISAATSFTVASYSAAGAAATTDVSSFDYFIVRQN